MPITTAPEDSTQQSPDVGELTEAQLADFEHLLATREQQLWAEVRALRESLSAPPDESGPEVRDQGDTGQRSLDLMQELTDLHRREYEIGEVNAARLRIREGNYGYCEQCGEPIPHARLRVLPTARLCVRHEEQRERTFASGRA